MSAEKSEYSCCQWWMAGGVFSAGIFVITNLVVVSFVYPLSPRLWKTWEKESGFGWHGGGTQ